MTKKIISEEQKKLNEVKNLYTSQKRKKFNYSPDDFSIDLLSGKWKHKDWKVWMKGAPSGDTSRNARSLTESEIFRSFI